MESILHLYRKSYSYSVALFMLCTLFVGTACRKIDLVTPAEYQTVPQALRPDDSQLGMYLVNEGNLGSNKSSIDFLDYRQGVYIRNLYSERNPDVVKELGDVGNDIQVYGSRLYVVVNSSHKVEVLDALTCRRIGQIDIPNCRYICFHAGEAFVSSYVGPVAVDPASPLGAVFRIDTATLRITGKVSVGYQPEELVVLDDYLYVANSGGYRKPNYDNTLSVVSLNGFKQIRRFPVGINLHRVRKDRYGHLWITSRGNYADIPSNLYVLSQSDKTQRMEVLDTLNIPCSGFVIKGDSLYYYSTEWNQQTEKNKVTYGILNVRTRKKVSERLITDGSEKKIKTPYGIAIHPTTGELFVTDATNYVSSGRLFCFTAEGRLQWMVRTGDIPAHMTFLPKTLLK